MSLELILQIASTTALVSGVLFGLVEFRIYRRRRRREAMLALVQTFQTPLFARAVRTLFQLPFGLTRREIDALSRDDQDSIWLLINTWESLGVLVHRGELDLELVDDFFSGPIALTWQKVGPYIEEIRAAQSRGTIAEWCQWLAERLLAREQVIPPAPAHLAEREWRPG